MMATQKILSYDDLSEMRQKTTYIAEKIDESLQDCKVVIDAFSNEEVVNSFFKSGKYGAKEKEKVERVLKAIQDFSSVIRTGDSNLYDQTMSYIDRQMELVSTGTSSTYSSSGTASFDGGYAKKINTNRVDVL